MQKITVKEVKGPLGRGENKFYAVVDDKGAEFTTFDAKIKQVIPGSVLEAELRIDGKYINIVEWKLVEEAPHVGATPADTNALLEQTRVVTRAQLQVATIQELGALLRAGMASQDEEALYRNALGIIMKSFASAPVQAAAAKPATAPEPVKPEDLTFEPDEPAEPPLKNIGELFTRARQKGYSRPDVMKYLEIPEGSQITNLGAAWTKLCTGLFRQDHTP